MPQSTQPHVKTTAKVALGGIVTALTVLVMFLNVMMPFATYCLPALAGLFIIIIVIEVNIKWAWGVFVASALLTLIVCPDVESKVLYIGFFGYYPIMKAVIEGHIKLRPIRVVLKYSLFNVGVVAAFVFLLKVVGIPDEELYQFGKWTPLFLLLIGNVIFFLYDYSLTGLIVMYIRKMHKRFVRLFNSNR